MNILVVCHYGLYRDLSYSFVPSQIKAYAAGGHRVRAVVPIAVGKRDWDGARFSGPLLRREGDGVELCPLRHLSLSNYGGGGFNVAQALRALEKNMDGILDGFVPDVIHANALGYDSSLGARLKERLGVPLVVTTHGSDTSVPVERGRAASLKPFCDQADAIVAVSSALAEKLRSCGSKTPVSVILNGFNLRALPERLEKSGVTIVQAGNFLEQKRFHVTIRSFARIRDARPEAKLILIGEGPKRRELENLCRELGLGNSVRFTGRIPNPDVLREMGKARFFVMPSVREGFGIVYLEAMASGCVTVGTEGEGVADLIRSGENGFLVPPDDPEAIVRTVEWCLDHPEEAAAIAERGRRDALELTWENNAAQYIRLFTALREGETRP